MTEVNVELNIKVNVKERDILFIIGSIPNIKIIWMDAM